MKQHITPEQIEQLTTEARERLRDWFEISYEPDNDIVRVYIPEEVSEGHDGVFAGAWEGEYEFSFPYPYIGKLRSHHCAVYPLLSIGEMFEVLDALNAYHPAYYVHYPADQLCDKLWDDLTDILKSPPEQ